MRLSTVACALSLAFPAETVAQNFEAYTRHSHSWTIEYPSGWAIDATETNYVEIRHPEIEALCGVHSGQSTVASSEELASRMLAAQEKGLMSQKSILQQVISRSRISAPPSVDGVAVLADLVPGGRSSRVYFVHDGFLTIVDCEAPVSVWAAVEDDFQNILASISFVETEAAKTFDAAIAALHGGNEEKAVELFRTAAEDGDARAQYGLGTFLYEGRGIEIDREASEKWLLRAAQQGQLDAQVAFWKIRFSAGYLSKSTAEEAFFWLRKAAENGNMESQYQLAKQLQFGGSILNRDIGEALEWYLVLAHHGVVEAQYEVGAILLHNSDLADPEAAFAWLSIAVANGLKTSEGLRDEASSLLSEEVKSKVTEKVNRCLETQYSDCDF